jgi:hypothetical protein
MHPGIAVPGQAGMALVVHQVAAHIPVFADFADGFGQRTAAVAQRRHGH